MFRDQIKKILGRVRAALRRSASAGVHSTSAGEPQILSASKATYSENASGYVVVVFSKDRPLQLHTLLTSLLRSARSPCEIAVLLAASSERFLQGYQECISVFQETSSAAFRIQQGRDSFRDDVIEMMREFRQSRIVFLVDDIIFIRDFSFADFDAYDLRYHVPSLRLGRTICHSYTTDMAMRMPAFERDKNGLLTWIWEGNDVDWGYPLSLDGNVFLCSEMLAILQTTSFFSPNTLESALQSYVPLFSKRSGLCYDLPRLVNIPCNRVQTDYPNRHGNQTIDFLLEKWFEGMTFDAESMRDLVADSVHVDRAIPFIPRRK